MWVDSRLSFHIYILVQLRFRFGCCKLGSLMLIVKVKYQRTLALEYASSGFFIEVNFSIYFVHLLQF